MQNKVDGLTNVDQTSGGEAPPPAIKNPPEKLLGVLIFAALAVVAFETAFPIPVNIEIDNLADADMPEADPIGATREAFVTASIHWLGAAGIVTFEAGQLGARMIERVGLTARGFLSLQSGHDGDGTISAALDRDPDLAERRSFVTRALAAAGRTFRSGARER